MKCPVHHIDLIPTTDPAWRGRLLVCPERRCTANHILPRAERQDKLPGLDPGKQSVRLRVAESALVQQWTQWGALHQYEVLHIGQRVHYLTCPACKAKLKQIQCPRCDELIRPELPSQNTEGAPDTFWTHPNFGHNWWKGLEAKTHEKAPVREAQARLELLGFADIVWTLEMVQAALTRRP